jgi:hypothetical protein
MTNQAASKSDRIALSHQNQKTNFATGSGAQNTSESDKGTVADKGMLDRKLAAETAQYLKQSHITVG